ncbi:hypothetical protein GQ42DRAFT_181866 [Ramicandelaber brevisporus]|nr:hypothetical protein GQ42DRAFT_181866 [Ramicandelaber brevisporus]
MKPAGAAAAHHIAQLDTPAHAMSIIHPLDSAPLHATESISSILEEQGCVCMVNSDVPGHHTRVQQQQQQQRQQRHSADCHIPAPRSTALVAASHTTMPTAAAESPPATPAAAAMPGSSSNIGRSWRIPARVSSLFEAIRPKPSSGSAGVSASAGVSTSASASASVIGRSPSALAAQQERQKQYDRKEQYEQHEQRKQRKQQKQREQQNQQKQRKQQEQWDQQRQSAQDFQGQPQLMPYAGFTTTLAPGSANLRPTYAAKGDVRDNVDAGEHANADADADAVGKANTNGVGKASTNTVGKANTSASAHSNTSTHAYVNALANTSTRAAASAAAASRQQDIVHRGVRINHQQRFHHAGSQPATTASLASPAGAEPATHSVGPADHLNSAGPKTEADGSQALERLKSTLHRYADTAVHGGTVRRSPRVPRRKHAGS